MFQPRQITDIFIICIQNTKFSHTIGCNISSGLIQRITHHSLKIGIRERDGPIRRRHPGRYCQEQHEKYQAARKDAPGRCLLALMRCMGVNFFHTHHPS